MNMQSGHDGILGWLAVAIGTAATLWTIAAAIYWILRPGELDPQHPKRIVLRNDR
jgi:hypothetical protein